MNRINMARVLIGGVVAGLVVNVGEFVLQMFVIHDQMELAVARLNLPPVGGQQIAVFVALAFALGIATVWLYAAVRPRFGAGPITALGTGATVWFFSFFYPTLGMTVMGLFPPGTMALALVWGLAEVLAAAVAGAYFYHEQEQQAAAPARL